jgi:hypothetical protein
MFEQETKTYHYAAQAVLILEVTATDPAQAKAAAATAALQLEGCHVADGVRLALGSTFILAELPDDAQSNPQKVFTGI